MIKKSILLDALSTYLFTQQNVCLEFFWKFLCKYSSICLIMTVYVTYLSTRCLWWADMYIMSSKGRSSWFIDNHFTFSMYLLYAEPWSMCCDITIFLFSWWWSEKSIYFWALWLESEFFSTNLDPYAKQLILIQKG